MRSERDDAREQQPPQSGSGLKADQDRSRQFRGPGHSNHEPRIEGQPSSIRRQLNLLRSLKAGLRREDLGAYPTRGLRCCPDDDSFAGAVA